VARALGADRGHAEDGCAFAWTQLCSTQPERGELFAWLRTTAVREVASPSASAGRARRPPHARTPGSEPAWEEHFEAPEMLEHALNGREAAELLTSLRRREGRYQALLAAG
jgi:hypothetical protein